MVVDAPNMNIGKLKDFAANGPLSGKAVNEGVVNTVIVKTAGGYVTIKNGSVADGVPTVWKK